MGRPGVGGGGGHSSGGGHRSGGLGGSGHRVGGGRPTGGVAVVGASEEDIVGAEALMSTGIIIMVAVEAVEIQFILSLYW